MIEIRIDGADTVAQVLHGTLAAVDPALRATGDEIFGRIWEAADKHTDKGQLIRSLKNSYRAGEYRIWHDLQHAPHAEFVHWPTRPHKIAAKNRKALRFPVGGKFVFAKWVNHPGYKGDPYFVTEAKPDDVLRTFVRFFNQEVASRA